MREIVTKTSNGYERDDGSARYIYNAKGEYLGQYQPDALSEEDSAGELYLATYPNDKCYHTLTQDQMQQAETEG